MSSLKRDRSAMNMIMSLALIFIFVIEVSKPLGTYAETYESAEIFQNSGLVNSSYIHLEYGIRKSVSELSDISIAMTNDNTTSTEDRFDSVYVVTEIPVSGKMYVNDYKVNLRKEPSTDSEIIDTLVLNDELDSSLQVVTSNDEEWVKVKTSDLEGYMMQKYVTTDPPLIYLGKYDITYYCPCEICCGVAGRATASGVMPTEGRTVAADPSVPFGTKLVIDGHEYVVEDRGGAIEGNHIDIYHTDHNEAFRMSKTSDVFMKKD